MIFPKSWSIELNDLFFNQNTAAQLDGQAKPIIEKIDASILASKYRICSRFDGVTLGTDQLSTGCKTVLNVLYNPDKVFCLKECGMNALEILYGLERGNVYSNYALPPFEMENVMVWAKGRCMEISDYEELKEWWEYEEWACCNETFFTVHTSFLINFVFTNNITILTGDSGAGKTASFSFIKECMAINPKILCINYLDYQKDVNELIKKEKGKLIVIDNADILLDDDTRKYISLDVQNQYLIIGRNPRNLFATKENLFELVNRKNGEQTELEIRPYLASAN